MLWKQKMVVLTLALAVAAPLACGSTPSSSPPATVAVPAAAAGHEMLTAANANSLLQRIPAGLTVIDVRTPAEFAAGHLAGAIDIDLQSGTFATDVAKLDPQLPYFVYCHSGNRSAQAVTVMQQHGFNSIYELQGGIEAWLSAGFPVVTG